MQHSSNALRLGFMRSVATANISLQGALDPSPAVASATAVAAAIRTQEQ